jgi:murein DD-endopeptidase MepM/ murein hydrolase activator NlpD
LLRWFPEREIYLRSQGKVRFVRISPVAQCALASALTVGFGLWLCASVSALAVHWHLDSERETLQQRATQIEREDNNLQRNRRQLDHRTQTLESRQQQLETIVHRVLGIQLARPPALKADKHSALTPIDQRLASIERRQLGFATAVTRSTSAEQERHRATFKLLGLPVPQATEAQGGPFIPYNGPMPSVLGLSPDALFAAMQSSLGQWQASRRFITALPAGQPVTNVDLTSPFGVRYDPFTRRPAVHPGQDFRGPYGSPIMAAGVGRVVHAGWLAGYGKAVMIDHGYRLVSLYGHMSRIIVKDGQTVRRGDEVGLIGSTGRSTGPHLHFEVRLDGRSINPRPLMEMNRVR